MLTAYRARVSLRLLLHSRVVFDFLLSLGCNLSVAAAFGSITLIGVAARFGAGMMVYLDRARRQWRKEGQLTRSDDLKSEIEEGAVMRIRPKAMTVATIFPRQLPIIEIGSTGFEVMRRIDAPIIDGMITAPLLSLFVIRAIYEPVCDRGDLSVVAAEDAQPRTAARGRAADGRGPRMKEWFRLRPLQLAILSLLLTAPVVMADQDAGGSYNLLLKASLTPDWFLISRSNLASRNNFEDNFLAYTGLGIGYQWVPNFSLRAGYRRAWFRFSDDWQPEDRGYLEGYFAESFDGFRLSNRARVEFRQFDWRDDDVRLRNEIVVEPPWPITPLKLKPYLEEEVFYSTRAGWIEANWLGVGLAWRPAKGVKVKLGYRWNHFRIGGDWANRNVLVTGINLFF
jgi:hypothetical protein